MSLSPGTASKGAPWQQSGGHPPGISRSGFGYRRLSVHWPVGKCRCVSCGCRADDCAMPLVPPHLIASRTRLAFGSCSEASLQCVRHQLRIRAREQHDSLAQLPVGIEYERRRSSQPDHVYRRDVEPGRRATRCWGTHRRACAARHRLPLARSDDLPISHSPFGVTPPCSRRTIPCKGCDRGDDYETGDSDQERILLHGSIGFSSGTSSGCHEISSPYLNTLLTGYPEARPLALQGRRSAACAISRGR